MGPEEKLHFVLSHSFSYSSKRGYKTIDTLCTLNSFCLVYFDKRKLGDNKKD
jgi:hypothetical protein